MSVDLISGSDQTLLARAVSKLTSELIGDRDRSLALAQFREEDLHDAESGWNLAPLVDAVQTPPLLTDRRVVVGRHLARLTNKNEYEQLARLLAKMLPTTDLLLVWERGPKSPAAGRLPAVPKKLAEAVKTAGGKITRVDPPYNEREANEWLRQQIVETSLRFEPSAVKALFKLVGRDRGLVVGCLRTLEGALGAKASVTAGDVDVYGGAPGSLVPWELDNAIDQGNTKTAIEVLHRQLTSWHPFQVLASLCARYQRMLLLDGSGAKTAKEAARILKMKGSTFPAKKLLDQTRRLGSKKIADAIRLLAEADLAMRGTLDWPSELALEVLVARLTAMSSRPSR